MPSATLLLSHENQVLRRVANSFGDLASISKSKCVRVCLISAVISNGQLAKSADTTGSTRTKLIGVKISQTELVHSV